MLTAKEIETRKQKRRNLVAQKELIELQAERIKAIVDAWDRHPEPKPVGKDFYTFVYNLLKNNNYVVDSSIAKIWAEKAAENIGWRTAQENPLNMEPESTPKTANTKEAATIYTPDEGSGGIYGPPDEQTRYCPEHPGTMLQRISDGVYQCPRNGDVYNLNGGHKVEFEGTLSEQFTDAVDDYRQSKVPVLFHGDIVGKASPSNTETEESYDTEKDHNILGGLKKKAHCYGPTEVTTRYCPDHPDVQLARVADGLYQCEVDGQVYHRSNSVANQTPNDPAFYGSRPGLKSAKNNNKIIKADARGDETRFIFDLMQALNGNMEKREIVEEIIKPMTKGDPRSLSMLISDFYRTQDTSNALDVEITEEK